MSLRELLGLSLKDQKVEEFLKKTVKDNKPEIKKFKETECHSYKKEGIAFDIKNEKIETIFVYNDKCYGFNKFKGELPEELSFELTNSEIVKKYGEPTGKGGFNMPVKTKNSFLIF